MIVHHVPGFVQTMFPDYTWHKDRESEEIYLTFDDGPVIGVTDKVLEILELYNCKATFFMVGDNVRKNPSLAKEVLAAGHQIGNHTYHHLKGHKTDNSDYFMDINKCQDTLSEVLGVEPKIFRPPYGRISASQGKEIVKTHEIIMWDVLSGDYDPNIRIEKCLKKTKKHVQKGSIIVFHDQLKTSERLPGLLEDFLDFTFEKGFLPVRL